MSRCSLGFFSFHCLPPCKSDGVRHCGHSHRRKRYRVERGDSVESDGDTDALRLSATSARRRWDGKDRHRCWPKSIRMCGQALFLSPPSRQHRSRIIPTYAWVCTIPLFFAHHHDERHPIFPFSSFFSSDSFLFLPKKKDSPKPCACAKLLMQHWRCWRRTFPTGRWKR